MSDAAVPFRSTMVKSARQIWAAPGSSHDRLIGFLNVALPISIGVLAAFVVVMPLFAGGDVSFVLDKKKVEVAKERLRTQAAIYRGEDAKGQAFQLNAGSAVQKSTAEPIVRLDDLSAKLQLTDGPATIVAPRGAYDMHSEQVKVEGPVKVSTTSGYNLQTSAATVDMKDRRMTSDGAVTGTLPQGTFSAGHLSADLEQRIVKLDGNARLRIVPGRKK